MGDWTYCGDGENNPEEQNEYLITWTGVLGSHRQRPLLAIAEWSDEWIVDDITALGWKDVEVVAWMPLPEAYKGQG